MPAGGHPVDVAFVDDSSIVVASHALSGSSLYMYGEEKSKTSNESKQQSKPPPEIKWEHHKVHERRAILTMFGATATYGTADGSTVIVTSSEGAYCLFILLEIIYLLCTCCSVAFNKIA